MLNIDYFILELNLIPPTFHLYAFDIEKSKLKRILFFWFPNEVEAISIFNSGVAQ